MESIESIKRHYRYTPEDEENRAELAKILLPLADQLADEFYDYLLEDPRTAMFFRSEQAIQRRKETIKQWLRGLLTAKYDGVYLLRLQKIGRVHVKIGLKGHYVNSAMNFIRSFCMRQVSAYSSDTARAEELTETLSKVLDISLDVMTSSYREEELRKVFVSYRLESGLVRMAERFLHGMNLVLMVGLIVTALGIVLLVGYDTYTAFSGHVYEGVIKVLGSLLILWMVIELLHTQVNHLQGGKFRVVVFVELALVAFIRKVFVASIKETDPLQFGLLLGGLLVIGVIFYLTGRANDADSPR